jgi:hypothetical protein
LGIDKSQLLKKRRNVSFNRDALDYSFTAKGSPVVAKCTTPEAWRARRHIREPSKVEIRTDEQFVNFL